MSRAAASSFREMRIGLPCEPPIGASKTSTGRQSVRDCWSEDLSVSREACLFEQLAQTRGSTGSGEHGLLAIKVRMLGVEAFQLA